MTILRKYLLRKFTDSGNYDAKVGKQGEVEEYGADLDHAIKRAMEKYGGSKGHWMMIGVISQ